MSANSFDAKTQLTLAGKTFDFFSIDALQSKYDVARLPFSLKFLL
jgi:aconitate hydratase